MLQAFTRSCVAVDAEKGGKFRLFDGNITGVYLQLVCFDVACVRISLVMYCVAINITIVYIINLSWK